AQPRRAKARRRLVDGAVDLPQPGDRGLVPDGDVPEHHRQDDERPAVEPVEPWLVERREVADAEEDAGDRRREDEHEVEEPAGGRGIEEARPEIVTNERPPSSRILAR